MKYRFLIFCCAYCIAFSVQAQTKSRPYSYHLSIPFRDGKLWGYADTLGKVLLEPQYDSVTFFKYGGGNFAIFKHKGRYGVLGKDYKVLIPNEYAEVGLPDIAVKGNVFAAKKDGKMGASEMDGKEIVPYVYDRAFIGSNVIIVKMGDKMGAFDLKGKLVLPIEYDSINVREMIAQKDGKNFIFNSKGSLQSWGSYSMGVPLMTEKQYQKKHKGRLEARLVEELNPLEDSLKKAKIIDRFLYDRPIGYTIFEENYTCLLAQKNKKVAVFSISDKTFKSDFKDDILDFYETGRYQTLEAIGPDDKEPEYKSYLVYKKNGKYGIEDNKGEIILPFNNDKIEEIGGANVIITQKKKKGIVIANTFYPPIPCKYDELYLHISLPVTAGWNFTILQCKLNGKPGFVGENGVEYFRN